MQDLTLHFHIPNESVQAEFLVRIGAVADEYGVSIKSKAQQDTEEERRRSIEEFRRRASEISKRIGPVDADSAVFLRSLRDQI